LVTTQALQGGVENEQLEVFSPTKSKGAEAARLYMNLSTACSNADRKLVWFLAMVVDRDSGLIGKDYGWEHRSLHKYIGTVPTSVMEPQVYKSAHDDIDREQDEDFEDKQKSPSPHPCPHSTAPLKPAPRTTTNPKGKGRARRTPEPTAVKPLKHSRKMDEGNLASKEVNDENLGRPTPSSPSTMEFADHWKTFIDDMQVFKDKRLGTKEEWHKMAAKMILEGRWSIPSFSCHSPDSCSVIACSSASLSRRSLNCMCNNLYINILVVASHLLLLSCIHTPQTCACLERVVFSFVFCKHQDMISKVDCTHDSMLHENNDRNL
jgi:hypothetical protein